MGGAARGVVSPGPHRVTDLPAPINQYARDPNRVDPARAGPTPPESGTLLPVNEPGLQVAPPLSTNPGQITYGPDPPEVRAAPRRVLHIAAAGFAAIAFLGGLNMLRLHEPPWRVPVGLAFTLLGGLPTFLYTRRTARLLRGLWRIHRDQCAHCGYSARCVFRGVCSECGRDPFTP